MKDKKLKDYVWRVYYSFLEQDSGRFEVKGSFMLLEISTRCTLFLYTLQKHFLSFESSKMDLQMKHLCSLTKFVLNFIKCFCKISVEIMTAMLHENLLLSHQLIRNAKIDQRVRCNKNGQPFSF